MTEKTVIDDYLETLPEPKRKTLSILRNDLRKLMPGAEECISYGMPGFRVGKDVIAGFAAFKNHLSYFPHSGKVLPELAEHLSNFVWKTGTLQFAIETPLPFELVAKLVEVRLRQLHIPK